MSYKSYKAGVERRRTLLLDQLVKSNQLRLEAHLPLYDIDQVVGDKEPLLTKEEHAMRLKERSGLAHFRKQQLTKANLPNLAPGNGWQQQRALMIRKAFVDHQLQVAWDSRKS